MPGPENWFFENAWKKLDNKIDNWLKTIEETKEEIRSAYNSWISSIKQWWNNLYNTVERKVNSVKKSVEETYVSWVQFIENQKLKIIKTWEDIVDSVEWTLTWIKNKWEEIIYDWITKAKKWYQIIHNSATNKIKVVVGNVIVWVIDVVKDNPNIKWEIQSLLNEWASKKTHEETLEAWENISWTIKKWQTLVTAIMTGIKPTPTARKAYNIASDPSLCTVKRNWNIITDINSVRPWDTYTINKNLLS